MPVYRIFGVDRDIDIPKDVFPSQAEIEEMESYLPKGVFHGWIESVNDGALLHYRRYQPKRPKAVVVWLHGITAHGGEGYRVGDRELAQTLMLQSCLDVDCAVYALDLYGHGYSEGLRFFVHDYKDNLRDLHKLIDLAVKEHPGLPVLLCGESYGSTLSLHLAQSAKVDSVFMTAPAIVLDLPPFIIYWFLRCLAYWFPLWIPFFMPNPLPPERVWRDPEVRAFFTQPRRAEMYLDGNGRPFRLGTALQVIQAVEHLTLPPPIPYCVVHGTHDYGVKPEGSELLWRQTPDHATNQFHQIEGGYHALWSDPLATRVAEHLRAWIQSRLQGGTKKVN